MIKSHCDSTWLNLKKNPEVDWAIVTDARGVVQMRSPMLQNTTGSSVASEKWFKEAQGRRPFYISPVIKWPDDQKRPAVLLCVPVRSERDDIIGFIAVVQKLDFIADSVGKLQLTDHAGVSVVDDKGYFLFSNHYVYLEDSLGHPGNAAATKAIKENLRQIRIHEGDHAAGLLYLSISTVANTGWKVLVERSQKDILHEAYEYFAEIFAGGVLLFACLSVCLIYLRKVFLLRQTRALLHAEVKFRRSEQRFKELFENMSSGVAVFRACEEGGDFIFKDINHAALRSENLNRHDVIGHTICDVFKGVREFGLFDLLHRVWSTGVAEYVPAWYYREDRRRGWKQNSVYRLPSGDVVMIFHDISKSKRAEETLKRSEETFSKVFKSNPAAIAIFRQRDGYIFWMSTPLLKI